MLVVKYEINGKQVAETKIINVGPADMIDVEAGGYSKDDWAEYRVKHKRATCKSKVKTVFITHNGDDGLEVLVEKALAALKGK